MDGWMIDCSGLLSLHDEGTDVIPRLLVMFSMSAVAVGKLLGPPTPAVYCLVPEFFDVKSMHHFRVVFLQVQVDLGLDP